MTNERMTNETIANERFKVFNSLAVQEILIIRSSFVMFLKHSISSYVSTVEVFLSFVTFITQFQVTAFSL